MDFRILGPLEAHDGGRQLALGGARQRMLLAMLLLHRNEVVSSDRLVEALWANSSLDEASKPLQMAMSRLRKALGPGVAADGEGTALLTRPPGYELRVEAGELDLDRFEALAAEGRAALESGDAGAASAKLGEALGVWRGPPLADLAYESFAQAEVARLEELRLATTEDRIQADLELGRHAELTGELEALARGHPHRERLRAQLMLALYRSGRQAEALAAYQDARRVLTEELGIEPSRELRELQEEILRQDPALDAPAAERLSAPAGPPGLGELVGRERELGELLALQERAASGAGSLALIGGEPGIGKSKLADRFGEVASERGSRVLVGRCWEAAGAPAYWPWVQALRSYVRELEPDALRSQAGPWAPELAKLVPEVRELLPDLAQPAETDSEGDRFRLFESVAAFLGRASGRQPLVLMLDDLHAADEPSLLLLRFVATEVAFAPLLVVGCYRDTEVFPGHPLWETLPQLARAGAVHRISLGGLERADVARLLESTTSREPTEELAARVHTGTEGNPLFACEIARLLGSEGEEGFAGAPDAGLPIPKGVSEAIAHRLQLRSDGCKRVLTLASVLGREFAIDALQRLSGLEQGELFELLDETTAARLIEPVPGSPERLRFSHVLIRDTVYAALPATRRPSLHREAGEALEAVYGANIEPHLAELAHHYAEAGSGQREKAIGYAARAGDRAAAQLAHEEAVRHYESALALIGEEASGPGEEACELLLALGEALSRAGDEPAAKHAFRRAAASAERSGRADQLTQAALGYGGRFMWMRGGSDPALVPLLESALSSVGDRDSEARVRLRSRLVLAARSDSPRERRMELADETVEMARRIGDPNTLLYALTARLLAEEGAHEIEDRLGRADEVVALAEQLGETERIFEGHEDRLATLWLLGDRPGVEVELDVLSRLVEHLRQPGHDWLTNAWRTLLALMEGRFEQAEVMIAETLELGESALSWTAVAAHRIQLFLLRREQGRLAQLERVFRRSVHEYPAQQNFQCALVHIHAELEHERETREGLDALLSADLATSHVDEEWIFGVSLLPGPCSYLGDVAVAEHLYELLLPHEQLVAVAPPGYAIGSVAHGLGVLATTVGDLDAAERHFEAALRLDREMGARPWEAHSRHDYSRMLLERGDAADGRGLELARSAAATYDELGMETWALRARSVEAALNA